MALKRLAKQDQEEVAKLLAKYWKERGMKKYNKKWAKDYLIKGHKKEIKKDEFFVYKEDNKIIGMISLITDVSDVAEIRDMLVKEEYRNIGYGKRMLKELIEIARKRKIRKLYALVFSKYINLYKSFGFEKEGVLKSHFAPNEDLTIIDKFL